MVIKEVKKRILSDNFTSRNGRFKRKKKYKKQHGEVEEAVVSFFFALTGSSRPK